MKSLILMASLIVGSFSAYGGVITQSGSFGNSFNSGVPVGVLSESFNFMGFDQSIGTLNSVEIVLDFTLES